MPHYEVTRTGPDTVAVRLEPQLYLAPQETRIGGLVFPTGIYVSAEIDELLIRTQLQLVVDLGRGISAEVGLAPIELLGGELLRVSSLDGTQGPLLSIATYSRPEQADPALREPHVMVTGAIRLLGLAGGATMLSLSSEGLAYRFEQSSALVQFALDGLINRHDLGQMHAAGTATVGFDREIGAGAFGNLHVQATIDGHIAITLVNSQPTITFAGGFHFMGLDVTIPSTSVAFVPDLLVDFAGTIKDMVGDALGAHLAILLGVAGGVGQLAGLFATQLGKAAGDVAPLLAHAGATAGDLAAALKAVYNLDPEQVVKSLLAAGLSVADISVGLKVGLALSEDAIVLALGGAKIALGTISTALHEGLKLAADDIGKLLNEIGLPGDSIAYVLDTVFDWPTQQILDFMQDVLGYTEEAARSAFEGVDDAGDAIESAFTDSADWLGDNLNPTHW